MTPVLTKKRPIAVKLSVDFPQRNETIVSGDYSLRVSAPQDCRKVEVSIDAGPWMECRAAVGHWWYDWSGYADGRHEVVARALTADERWVPSEPRKLLVKLASQAGSAGN